MTDEVFDAIDYVYHHKLRLFEEMYYLTLQYYATDGGSYVISRFNALTWDERKGRRGHYTYGELWMEKHDCDIRGKHTPLVPFTIEDVCEYIAMMAIEKEDVPHKVIINGAATYKTDKQMTAIWEAEKAKSENK